MLTFATKSTDPVAVMQTVGTVDGVVVGISVAMIIIGLVGKKASAKRKRQTRSEDLGERTMIGEPRIFLFQACCAKSHL